ncbi:MAG: type II secretion system GspH family protein [Lentisphaeraceae bacterium]|nr:type II secretion system GspH family protein [Lentisphaeraceae bacterium]
MTRINDKFTLIELLIVVAIIGILASLLLPSLSKARKSAMIAVSVSNMKQLGVAQALYVLGNKDRFITSRYPTQVNIAWDDMMNDLLGFNMTQSEIASDAPAWRDTFKVLQCPLDEVTRTNSNYFKRTYELNGYSSGSSPRIFQYGTTLSMFVAEIDLPSETIAMNEQSKSHNSIGGGSNVVMVGGNIDEVTINTVLTGNVRYDPNHHENRYRNPLLFIDGHVVIKDMRQTRGNSDYLWKSRKP